MFADRMTSMRRPSFENLSQRAVLITGAGSGIGRALAEACARQGAQLYLTDVDADALAVVAESTSATLAVAADVSQRDEVMDLAAAVHRQRDAVDVVMNVAGISAWGSVDRLAAEQWRSMVEVNLMGPIHVIEAFVPAMIDAGRGGHLVNVSSAAGLLGLPWHAAYSASKFGLRGVSEVLRFDLERHGIGVSLVCPGAVATGLTETVQLAGVDTSNPKIQELRNRFVAHAATPEQVAAKTLKAVKRNRYLVHTAWDVRAGFLLQRYVPAAYNVAMRRLNTTLVNAAADAMAPRS
jgi:NAD(P)-dependent dehydrogenase (short-subunit alcohol dehydrogenase family)